MDELDREIDNLKKRLLKWKKAIAAGEVELASLEKAAKLRPSANAVRRPADADDSFYVESGVFAPADAQSVKAGRRPGSISAEWREVLEILYNVGGAHSYAQIHDTARRTGRIDAKEIASTRDRVRSFAANNFMTGNAEVGFTVTEDAAERFGFKRNSAPPWDDFPDGAEKVEGA